MALVYYSLIARLCGLQTKIENETAEAEFIYFSHAAKAQIR
jgi:hypothetical protein